LLSLSCVLFNILTNVNQHTHSYRSLLHFYIQQTHNTKFKKYRIIVSSGTLFIDTKSTNQVPKQWIHHNSDFKHQLSHTSEWASMKRTFHEALFQPDQTCFTHATPWRAVHKMKPSRLSTELDLTTWLLTQFGWIILLPIGNQYASFPSRRSLS
jgi:hypothetical protein